jgi:MFS-type transporter involved in bile tolerance (Atg22 family)
VQTRFPSGFFDWGGQRTSTNSYLVDLGGIQFAVQLAVLLIIGPYADYGSWRPYLLIFWTSVGVICSLAFFGFTDASTWQAACALYVLGYLCVQVCASFYIAAFPNLIRDLPEVQESERQVIEGTKTPEEHANLDMLQRSKMSNWSYIFSGLGSALSIILTYAIVYGVGYQTQEQNNKVYSIIVGFFGIIWILSSLPWFLIEQHRPGQQLPDNTSWLTVGPKQIWEGVKHASRLKQTFLYILCYFMIADSASTSGTLINLLENDAINFDTVLFNGLFIVVYSSSFIGIFLQMWIQQHFRIPPKWMFYFNAVTAALISLWGLIGLWTTKIGFHHLWEFWFFQVWSGFMAAGFQSYAATVMAEVSPAPKMYIFFALFNTIGQASGFVGPYISAAIINAAGGNIRAGFWFTWFLGLTGFALLTFLDVDRAKIDNAKYLELEREELYASHGAVEVAAEVIAERSASTSA